MNLSSEIAGAWPSKVLLRSILHFLAPTAPSEDLLLFRKGQFSLGYKMKNNIPLYFGEHTLKSLIPDIQIHWESIYPHGLRLKSCNGILIRSIITTSQVQSHIVWMT